jgi:protein O-GlcNAc transferase
MMDSNRDQVSSMKAQALALLQNNRFEEARTLFMHICDLAEDDAEAWIMLGNVNGQLGHLDETEICYRRVLELQPNIAVAHSNLGNVYTLQGKHEEALASYREAVRLDPSNALAHCNLGALLKTMGRVDEATAHLRNALRLNPNLAEAHNNLGNILSCQARLDEALVSYQDALLLKPGLGEIHGNVGDIYARQGKLDDALASYREALRLDPRNAAAHSNLGALFRLMGRIDEAIGCFQYALHFNPSLAEAHNNLGNIFFDQGRFDEALVSYKKALNLRPDLDYIHSNLGSIYTRQGKLDEALASYREALRLGPRNALTHSNLLFLLNYHADYDEASLYAEHVRWGETYSQSPENIEVHSNSPEEERQLRIGYICADFRNHPVGYFLEGVLVNHDKNRFEVYCYSNHSIHDDLTARLRGHAAQWRDIVGQTDEAVARNIRDDRIDILVDLAGHTAGNRLLTLAYKPAPIQATWMSYIATTGLKAVDYIIADRYVIPVESEGYYVEQVARLPNVYLCFTPPQDPVEVSALPALSRKEVTFGCFNNTAKLTPETIATWAKLLQALPQSRIFLKSASFDDERVKEHYRGLFAIHGVHAERLKFAGHSPRQESLAAYQGVDIGLDPFPYTGGTTTAEALWMGVPVISLRGNRFVSRIGESFLSTVGLREYVVDSEDAYIAKAIALASDLPRLADIRQQLREQMLNSPLCDCRGFTRDLEAAYRKMWETWCRTRVQSNV